VADAAAELALKERAMDEAPVGITISDPSRPDNPVVYANAAFERITGYPVEEVMGRNCRFLQGPETDEETVAALRQAIEEDYPITVEIRNYREDGTPFWNEVTVAPLRDDEGTVTHYVGFQRDVTDRREAETHLERERDRLAVLNQIVRHDIRNDMAVVLGWGERLRESVEGDDEHTLERMLNAATHTSELTKAVRDLAETIGAEDPALTAVDLGALLRSEVERVRASFDYRSEPVSVSVEEVPEGVTVRATSLLSSVFGNLLDNAVFHNDTEHVEIDVGVEEREETVVVRVADNGPGVPDERKRSVFGRGERGLESPGSGLGLYLVDNLVDTYGGAVWVEDNDPEGAVFCVELPKARADP
jgi:PAS domain S-box-containing protein